MLALCLYGRVGGWAGPSTDHRPALWDAKGLSQFAYSSFEKHVILPNEKAGVEVRTYLHSWNPELGPYLDGLYGPHASA